MPVVDELSIKLSLEAGDLQRGLELFIGKIAEAAQEIGQALGEGVAQAMQEVGAAAGEAGEASQQAAEAVSEVGEAAQEAGRQGAEGMREIGRASRQMRSQVSRDARMIEMASRRVTGHIKALVMRFAGPLVAGFTAGAMINNYISDLGKVAELTGAYNKSLEEERKKKAMLQRVTKEDLALYKKSREALVSFQIATQTVSNALMRAFGPAIEKIAGWLEKAADWLERNQDNIVRFAKVAAGVITTILMPAIIALGLAMLRSPFGWMVMGLTAIVLVIDDLITYIQGGKTAFGALWEKFGTGPEIAAKLSKAWEVVKNVLSNTIPVVGALFAAFKGGQLIGAIMAHPIIAGIAAIVAAIAWLIANWDEVKAVAAQVGAAIKSFFINAANAVKAKWEAVCNWFAQKFEWLFGMIDRLNGAWGFVKEGFGASKYNMAGGKVTFPGMPGIQGVIPTAGQAGAAAKGGGNTQVNQTQNNQRTMNQTNNTTINVTAPNSNPQAVAGAVSGALNNSFVNAANSGNGD